MRKIMVLATAFCVVLCSCQANKEEASGGGIASTEMVFDLDRFDEIIISRSSEQTIFIFTNHNGKDVEYNDRKIILDMNEDFSKIKDF